jgi:hypothetical protein
MPINLQKMAEERAKRALGGEMITLKEGETRVYVCAFARPEDDTPYYEYKMHYGLGNDGKKSHFCLEPQYNRVLLLDAFAEQAAALKKVIGEGCPTCEKVDRGESISSNPDESGKPQSRWLFIISPRGHRSDVRQNFTPWGQDEVRGLDAPYRVWNGIMDQFGGCGDLTDMDAAIYIRIIREGVKLNTKWDVQADIETARKPLKMDKVFREMVATAVAPGGPFDPLRLIANMVRNRSELEKYLAEKTDGEYSEPPGGETPPPDQSNFKPPTKGKPAATQAPKPAAPPTKQPPAAGATKAAPPKPAAKATNGVSNANTQLKALTAKHGQPPPCFQVDADPGAEICVGSVLAGVEGDAPPCPFNKLCFDHMGVTLPTEPPNTPVETVEEVEEVAAMTVEQCVAGESYVVNGINGVFKGLAKGAYYFIGDDTKAFKVEPGTVVEAPADEAPADDDSDAKMAALEQELASRKNGKAATAKK